MISFDLSKNQIFIRFVFDCQENLGWGRKKNIIKLGFFFILCILPLKLMEGLGVVVQPSKLRGFKMNFYLLQNNYIVDAQLYD